MCDATLAAGTSAYWDGGRRLVTCVDCHGARATTVPIEAGTAGASAKSEAARRRARQAERKRQDIEARPILGRLAHALAPEPDAGHSWAVGAVGEEKLGAALDALCPDVRVLHDRRVPRSTANIDHLAVTANGVWVIDAKRYTGRVATVDKGGWFRTDIRLTVGGRDRTKLIAGVHKQVAHVKDGLASQFADVPVHGVLCFIDAEWGLFSKPFTLDGVFVTWGKALRQRLQEPGPLDPDRVDAIHSRLASAFAQY